MITILQQISNSQHDFLLPIAQSERTNTIAAQDCHESRHNYTQQQATEQAQINSVHLLAN